MTPRRDFLRACIAGTGMAFVPHLADRFRYRQGGAWVWTRYEWQADAAGHFLLLVGPWTQGVTHRFAVSDLPPELRADGWHAWSGRVYLPAGHGLKSPGFAHIGQPPPTERMIWEVRHPGTPQEFVVRSFPSDPAPDVGYAL